jgi:hypothetical protein
VCRLVAAGLPQHPSIAPGRSLADRLAAHALAALTGQMRGAIDYPGPDAGAAAWTAGKGRSVDDRQQRALATTNRRV